MIYRSNKKKGTAYEEEVVKLLSHDGYWSHRIEEDKRGAQPFDVIAVKNKIAYAIDCKTLDTKVHIFYMDRMEENQISAFNKWIECGNTNPLVFVKWRGDITYVIDFVTLQAQGKFDMNQAVPYSDGIEYL